MRVGQALGLRHATSSPAGARCTSCPGPDNANGARAKLRSPAVVPVSAPLVRLYSEYMHAEYGDIDSDYVFVNLFGGRVGRRDDLPGGAPADRPHRRPHRDRLHRPHAPPYATPPSMVRRGVPIEVVARLLTHRSSTTTSQIYVHLDAADIREALTGPACGTRGAHGEQPGASRGRQARLQVVTARRPASTANGPRTTGTPAPGRPRPARARHGAVRRDHPGLAARPGRSGGPGSAWPPGARSRPSPPGHWRCPGSRRSSPSATRGVADEAGITRPVLEDYLSWLLAQGYSAATRALSLSDAPGVLRRLPPPWLAARAGCHDADHLRRGAPLPPRPDRPVHPRVRDGPARVRRRLWTGSRSPPPATSSWS